MKTIFTLLFITLCSLVKSQNQGVYPENNILKLEYIGYNTDRHIFKVTNKVNCDTEVTMDKGLGLTTQTIHPNSSIFVEYFAPLIPSVRMKVKRNRGADCIVNPDNGWIELNSIIVLPTTFLQKPVIKFVENNIYIIRFVVNQTDDIKQYNIKYSLDGKKFRILSIILPKNSNGINTYETKISLR